MDTYIIYEEQAIIVPYEVYEFIKKDNTRIESEYRQDRRKLSYYKLDENIYNISLIPNDNVFEHMLLKNDKIKIREALIKLSKKQQRRIIKYFFYQMSYTEIAESENISSVAVKKSIEWGLKKLKLYLAKELIYYEIK